MIDSKSSFQKTDSIELSQKSNDLKSAWLDEFNKNRFNYQFSDKSIIGKGSFGEVWRAKSKVDCQIYCIKMVDMMNDTDALNESRAFAKISKIYHPNIVRYYGSWIEAHPVENEKKNSTNSRKTKMIFSDPEDESGANQSPALKRSKSTTLSHSQPDPSAFKHAQHRLVLFFQMELCEMSLMRWIDERNAKGETNLVANQKICRQIIDAVSFIHSNDIVHRDIRPANIFINSSNLEVKVGDFGIATHVWTSADPIFGVYYYTPPDQLVTPKFDVFSVGIVLYEVLTVFQTLAERHYMLVHIKENFELPPSVGQCQFPPIFYLISKMIDKTPESRPDLREIAESISQLKEHQLELMQLNLRIRYLENLLSQNSIDFD